MQPANQPNKKKISIKETKAVSVKLAAFTFFPLKWSFDITPLQVLL
jgi:hypothetical protein